MRWSAPARASVPPEGLVPSWTFDGQTAARSLVVG